MYLTYKDAIYHHLSSSTTCFILIIAQHACVSLKLITALELAVHHGWGGQNSAEKANMLMEDVITLFTGPQRIYKDVSKV